MAFSSRTTVNLHLKGTQKLTGRVTKRAEDQLYITSTSTVFKSAELQFPGISILVIGDSSNHPDFKSAQQLALDEHQVCNTENFSEWIKKASGGGDKRWTTASEAQRCHPEKRQERSEQECRSMLRRLFLSSPAPCSSLR